MTHRRKHKQKLSQKVSTRPTMNGSSLTSWNGLKNKNIPTWEELELIVSTELFHSKKVTMSDCSKCFL